MGKLKLGKYEHYKQSLRPDGLKGGLYEVLGITIHTETLEEMVLYKQLHDHNPNFPKGTLWVRPKANFLEKVKVKGKEVPRFKYLDEVKNDEH